MDFGTARVIFDNHSRDPDGCMNEELWTATVSLVMGP
jgi:hypothetical protein